MSDTQVVLGLAVAGIGERDELVAVDAVLAGNLVNAGYATWPDVADSTPTARASKDEWAAYAAALGIDIPDGATKADIIALVQGAP